jgi:hypothetical protein
VNKAYFHMNINPGAATRRTSEQTIGVPLTYVVMPTPVTTESPAHPTLPLLDFGDPLESPFLPGKVPSHSISLRASLDLGTVIATESYTWGTL